MLLIESNRVDLIAPFPITEAKRVYHWNHCYKSIAESDVSPKTAEEFEEWMKQSMANCLSFGVIDKHGELGIRHEAPLIGVLIFEPTSNPYNGYFHVASSRRAWGSRMIDEAGEVAIRWVFENCPTLTRVSAAMLDANKPAKALCRRLGFVFEGVFEDMILLNTEPKPVAHFGLTRRNWEWQLQSPLQSESEAPSSEVMPTPETKAEEKPQPPETAS